MAQKWQGRRKDGKFLPSIAKEGFNAPKSAPLPPVYRVKAAQVASSTNERTSITSTFSFAPLADGEAQRLLFALTSALRASNTRADRAAQSVERNVLEDRFGAINWAA